MDPSPEDKREYSKCASGKPDESGLTTILESYSLLSSGLAVAVFIWQYSKPL